MTLRLEDKINVVLFNEFYINHSDIETANEFNIHRSSVIRLAKRQGLKKEKEYIEYRDSLKGVRGKNHYKWKGGKPWQRFATPEYRKWRKSVLERDNYTCQNCGCKYKNSARELHAHHIKSYTDFPELRYEVTNGISLCKECHMKAHGKSYIVKMIECACGCGSLLKSKDNWGRKSRFIKFHQVRTRKKVAFS